MQPVIAAKRVSFTTDAKHAQRCIDQASKITANNTHRFDDIIDTLYDACKIALIDKTIYHAGSAQEKNRAVVRAFDKSFKRKIGAKKKLRHY
jgi:hypothetical protein